MQRHIATMLQASRSSAAAELAEPEPVAVAPVPEPVAAEEAAVPAWLPGPRAIAFAIMGILAFGVIVGSLLNPIAESVAGRPLLVAVNSPPPAAAAAPAPAPAASDDASSSDNTPAPQQTVTETVQSVTPPPDGGGSDQTAPTGPSLPPIKHVFLIALSDQGYNQSFGEAADPNSYLAKSLVKQGELLPNYYAVAPSELANAVALISGQGPNDQTAANCPTFSDITPGTLDADKQVTGSGCVYPTQATTLPDELVSNGNSWKAYIEDVGNGAATDPKTCRHPALGQPDPAQAPQPNDAYVTWRNPFVYFHSLIDTTSCSTGDVGLDQLATDLKSIGTSPSFSYIVPNRCHDGSSDQPCTPGQPAGLAATDEFLKTVVPEITASAAYKADGLIAITFDQASQTGPECRPELLLRHPGLSEPDGRRDGSERSQRSKWPQRPDGPDRSDGSYRAHRHDWSDRARRRDGIADRRRGPSRPAADLEVRQAGNSQHGRLLQPLLAAAQHRAALQHRRDRLRVGPDDADLRHHRLHGVQRLAGPGCRMLR